MFTRTLKVSFKNKQHEVVLLLRQILIPVTNERFQDETIEIHGLFNDVRITDKVNFTSLKRARSFIKNFTTDMAKDFLQDQFDSLSIENKPKTEK